jgi:4-phosphopantoate--beta-alanine ligase
MNNDHKNNQNIPQSHPRYESLIYRHKIIEGMQNLVVAEAGLIAHGRGECFDYIIGEKTNETAKKALEAAVAMLLLAKNPVISVNGNVAALVPKELVGFAEALRAPLEINLFYKKEGRIEAIKNVLENAGAKDIRGIDNDKLTVIQGLDSNRRMVESIADCDVILVPLEDGDRTEALKKIGKKVIAIDLNPLSRTSMWADITIVDNIIRAIPKMIKISVKLKNLTNQELRQIIDKFNNKENLINSLDLIIKYIETQKEILFKKLN